MIKRRWMGISGRYRCYILPDDADSELTVVTEYFHHRTCMAIQLASRHGRLSNIN